MPSETKQDKSSEEQDPNSYSSAYDLWKSSSNTWKSSCKLVVPWLANWWARSLSLLSRLQLRRVSGRLIHTSCWTHLTRHLKDAAEHDKLRSDYDKLKNNLETSERRFRKVQRLVKSLKEIVEKFQGSRWAQHKWPNFQPTAPVNSERGDLPALESPAFALFLRSSCYFVQLTQ